MKVIRTIAELKEWVIETKQAGRTIGLVPTMGWLHEGHFSLLREAKKNCNQVVVSIFVNPLQFGQGEDYEEYPRDLTRDSRGAEKEGADVIFAPSVQEMYPRGFKTTVEVKGITEKLCGASRPGHFLGVCTVVTKLFNLVQPDKAFFGQKDAQQVAVIKTMVEDLNMPLSIEVVPIVREADGLALSSRNSYLSQEERKGALVLSKALRIGENLILQGERKTSIIKKNMEEVIKEERLAKIDYIAICIGKELEEAEELPPSGEALLALAVYMGKTRLIDNTVVCIDNGNKRLID